MISERLLSFGQSLPTSAVTWIAQEITFHLVGCVFDYCDTHSLFPRTKVRSSDRRTYTQLLPKVLLNQFCLLLPAMMIMERLGLAFSGSKSISWPWFLAGLVGMAIGHDVVQYLFHRHLLHRPNLVLMRWLRHSIHHSTAATKAISACYMSPPDFLLEIICPYLLPLILFGHHADMRFHLIIAVLGAIGGLYEHSGYDFSVPLRQERISSRASSPGMAIKAQDGSYTPPRRGGRKSEKTDVQMEEVDEEFNGVTAFIAHSLAAFLDNRAHSEHHTRANVSFSDGFGSPGLCDTIFRTRWDLSVLRRRTVEDEWKSLRLQDAILQ